MLAALAVMVLGYIGVFFGRLLQAAVSRHRERLADASAVQFTRNPAGLSGALLKIAGVSSGSRLVTPAARKWRTCCSRAGMPRLFATHPSLEERLKALDPAFRAAELPALAAAAARDAQRHAAGWTSAAAGSAAAPPAAARCGRTARHWRRWPVMRRLIAAQAGTIATEQVRYAERARAAIPEGLREFVDSADHARTLMLAVLASKVPEVQAAQRRVLEDGLWPGTHRAGVRAARPGRFARAAVAPAGRAAAVPGAASPDAGRAPEAARRGRASWRSPTRASTYSSAA